MTKGGTVDNMVKPAGVPIEHSLAECLRQMRILAAEAGTDDHYETWNREVLDRRPLIMLAVATDDGTWMWVREPGEDGVVHAKVRHFRQADGETVHDVGYAELAFEDRTLHDISQSVSWLMKDHTGEPLPEERLARA